MLQTSQLSGTVQHAATQDAMRTWLQPMAEAIGCCVYLESRAPSKKKVNSALYRESSARIDYMCVAPTRKGFQFCHGSCGSTSSCAGCVQIGSQNALAAGSVYEVCRHAQSWMMQVLEATS